MQFSCKRCNFAALKYNIKMKKSLFFMLAIICLACTNDYDEAVDIQEEVSISPSVNVSKSLVSLKSYNDSLSSQPHPAITRGLGNMWIVSAADGIAVCGTLPVLFRAG